MNVGDQYLQTLDIRYHDRWRDFGIFLAFTAFNAFLAYVSPPVSTNATYLNVSPPKKKLSGLLLHVPCSADLVVLFLGSQVFLNWPEQLNDDFSLISNFFANASWPSVRRCNEIILETMVYGMHLIYNL